MFHKSSPTSRHIIDEYMDNDSSGETIEMQRVSSYANSMNGSFRTVSASLPPAIDRANKTARQRSHDREEEMVPEAMIDHIYNKSGC